MNEFEDVVLEEGVDVEEDVRAVLRGPAESVRLRLRFLGAEKKASGMGDFWGYHLHSRNNVNKRIEQEREREGGNDAGEGSEDLTLEKF